MKPTLLAILAIAAFSLSSCGILNPVSETVFGQPLIQPKPTPYSGAYGTRATNAYDVMIKEIEADMLKGGVE
jgi:hypothetical protein